MAIIYSAVQAVAAHFPEKEAVRGAGGNALTYSQLVDLVGVNIRNLRSLGVSGKTRVAFCLNEGVEVPVTVLALNALGATVIPLNPGLQPSQAQSFLHSVDAEVVITEQATEYLFEQGSSGIRALKLKDLNCLGGETHGNDEEFEKESCLDQFLLTLSSGSTGSPKPILFSEVNKLERARQAIGLYGITNNDVVLCASPFYHSLGQRLTFVSLLAGATLVILPRFSTRNWCSAVVDNAVTFTIPVSSHLHELVSVLLEKPFRFPSLRSLVSSSAAINDEVKKHLFECLPCDFYEMYGASEVATATSLNKRQADKKLGSVGSVCPGVRVRIVNEQFMDCRAEEVGQIAVKSPLASAGYYKLPHVTSESFVDGYFLTGDLGYLDHDRYLYFVDRKKDVVVCGGINIYPSDIEPVINEIYSVKTSVVIGLRDPYLGEVPVAIVVGCGGVHEVELAIRDHVNKSLAAFQRPLKYFFRQELPLTASGKIDKRVLRDELNALNLDLTSKLRAFQNAKVKDDCDPC